MKKKWLKRVLWAIFAVGSLVILVLVQGAQKSMVVAKPEIVIHVDGENAFLTEDELYDRLKRKGFFAPGQKHKDLNVSGIETFIYGYW
jgi:hypothetical protein